MKFHRHVFVCTRNRGADHPRGCCATKGSEALALALKLASKEAGLGRVVRVQESGCLDQLDELNGITDMPKPQRTNVV